MFQPPKRVQLGQHSASQVGFAESEFRAALAEGRDTTLCGFRKPVWQRPFVWTEAQQLSFLESLWEGFDVGTFTLNRVGYDDKEFDNLIIDGQQRLTTLARYFKNEIEVFGAVWEDVDLVNKRRLKFSTHFAHYQTHSTDDAWLRAYYNRMNYSGTPHKESERA